MGGAIAANQCEGAWNEGNKGLSNADVLPFGKDRMPVIKGDVEVFEPDTLLSDAQQLISIYHRYKKDM